MLFEPQRFEKQFSFLRQDFSFKTAKPTAMDINGSTILFGVIGNPISHSLSPIMHNAAFAALGINAVYIPLKVNPDFLQHTPNTIKNFGFKGVNVTIPFKQTIVPYIDEIQGDSVFTRSVNTIYNNNGIISGTSTDGIGFLRSLQEDGGFDSINKNVILLGSGGTAYAVAFRLINAGVSSIVCYNRSISHAEKLQYELFKHTGFKIEVYALSELGKSNLYNYNLLINTTSVGLYDDQSLLSGQKFHNDLFIYDVVYKKGGSRLIRDAAQRGCRFLDGLSLLVYQGAESFRIWFNQEPPILLMKSALQNYLNQ